MKYIRKKIILKPQIIYIYLSQLPSTCPVKCSGPVTFYVHVQFYILYFLENVHVQLIKCNGPITFYVHVQLIKCNGPCYLIHVHLQLNMRIDEAHFYQLLQSTPVHTRQWALPCCVWQHIALTLHCLYFANKVKGAPNVPLIMSAGGRDHKSLFQARQN